MKLKEITSYIESIAPLNLQESYDNSGLLIGNYDSDINSVLICLEVTEKVLQEAIKNKNNLIISHHPLIFNGIKRITGDSYVERIIEKSIKNNISIYSSHTNLDNVKGGVNGKIAEILELQKVKILRPKLHTLKKLVTYVPNVQLEAGVLAIEKVRHKLFSLGAGHIGNYSDCSFNSVGTGTYTASAGAKPFLGKKGQLHRQEETKLEVIFPFYQEAKILEGLFESHPYEEVAYEIFPIDNVHNFIGAGIIGELEKEMSEKDFLLFLKEKMKLEVVRHTSFLKTKIKKVALCGGSGSFLIEDAKKHKANIFISGDIKYHDFFKSDNQIIIADIGHFESEKFTIDLLYDIFTKKFPNFAFFKTKKLTNSINYI